MNNNSLTCTLKYATTSYKKLNLMAKFVRGKNVVIAMDQLQFVPRKTADIFYKVIKSAVANASNNAGYSAQDLYIAEVNVGRGPKIKRYRYVAKGSAHNYIKHRSFLKVVLGVK